MNAGRTQPVSRDGLLVLGVKGADGAHDLRQIFPAAVGEPGATNLVLSLASWGSSVTTMLQPLSGEEPAHGTHLIHA